MKVTKYDIADVLVVCVCVSYIPTIIMMLSFQATMLLEEWAHLGVYNSKLLLTPLFQIGYCALGCFLLYLLILKRAPIIRRLFPESEVKEIVVPEGLVSLTQYSFWIRLLGIVMILRESVKLIQGIGMEITRSQFDERTFNFIIPFTQPFIGVVLALLIIWKADWITEKIKSIT